MLHVFFPGGCSGHTLDPAQGLALAPGTVARGHAVVHGAALALVLPGTVLQRTGLLEIGHRRTGQDPGTGVQKTGLAPGTMDALAHPQIALKAIPAPGLDQGAGKSAAFVKGMLLHFKQSEEVDSARSFPSISALLFKFCIFCIC